MITKEEFEEYCRTHNLRYKFDKFCEEILLAQNWNKYSLFILLCYYGYIETLKWLYTKEEINIHAEDEYLFRLSCRGGKFQIAKWLFEISKKNGEMINIHLRNEDAFKWSCKFDQIEVAKWLCSLCDEYYVEIKNNKIVKYGIKNMFDKYLDENKGIKKVIKKLQLKII